MKSDAFQGPTLWSRVTHGSLTWLGGHQEQQIITVVLLLELSSRVPQREQDLASEKKGGRKYLSFFHNLCFPYVFSMIFLMCFGHHSTNSTDTAEFIIFAWKCANTRPPKSSLQHIPAELGTMNCSNNNSWMHLLQGA